jgi:amphi-Trp domain-containing protein
VTPFKWEEIMASGTARADRDLEKSCSRKMFAARLRRLADAVEGERPFRIQVGGERLLIPPGAELSVEHEREDGVEELEFQLRWRSRDGRKA